MNLNNKNYFYFDGHKTILYGSICNYIFDWWFIFRVSFHSLTFQSFILFTSSPFTIIKCHFLVFRVHFCIFILNFGDFCYLKQIVSLTKLFLSLENEFKDWFFPKNSKIVTNLSITEFTSNSKIVIFQYWSFYSWIVVTELRRIT